MNDDDELPRSSAALKGLLRRRRIGRRVRAGRSAPTGARRRVNALKIILAALLVAINAFFVIAEYALVRSRRTRLEQMC